MTTLGERFVQALAAKDRDRVGWRFAVTTPDGPHLVEQQAFYSATGDQIGWMRVMCSGFRPAAPA
jgi:hypothetical protein